MRTIPLFGSGTRGRSNIVSSQRRLNCYAEMRQDGDKTSIVLFGTPGMLLHSTLSPTPDGPIRGFLESPLYLYVVAGSYLYKIPADGSASTSYTGTITTTSGPVSMTHNGTQVLIVDGNRGYIHSAYNTAGGTLSLISDTDFPNGARTCGFLAGYFFAEDPDNPGRFQWSASYDGTSWLGTAFATAEQDPDPLVAVDVGRGNLILFGRSSIEYWQPIGAVDIPVGFVSAQGWGLAACFSRAKIDNSMIFLAQNQQGQVQVMQVGGAGGYVPVRVSDSDIEGIINDFSTVDDAVALSYLWCGHPFYQITFPTANRSFLYDCLSKLWSEVQTGVAVEGRHSAQHAATFQGKTIVSDATTANLYNFDADTYTDNGTTIKRQIITRHGYRDHNKIRLARIMLDVERGVGLSTGQGSDPTMMLRISRNGGQTFGPERWATFGKIGQYKTPRLIWRRCGASRDFVLEFTMTDPVKFVVTGGAGTVRERAQ